MKPKNANELFIAIYGNVYRRIWFDNSDNKKK